MSIDRIGKGPPEATPAATPPSAERTGAEFKVTADKPEGVEGAPPTDVTAGAPTPFDDLRAGKITLSEYSDRMVERGMSHLEGLSPQNRAIIRETIKSMIETDPGLQSLLQDVAKDASGKPQK